MDIWANLVTAEPSRLHRVMSEDMPRLIGVNGPLTLVAGAVDVNVSLIQVRRAMLDRPRARHFYFETPQDPAKWIPGDAPSGQATMKKLFRCQTLDLTGVKTPPQAAGVDREMTWRP